jgi:hypothetical protein
MQHIDQNEIQQRVRDILTNITILTSEGKLGFLPLGQECVYWMRLWTDVLEELSLRGGGFTEGFLEGTPIPNASWPALPRAVAALGNREFDSGKYLFKFGKEKHLRRFLHSGDIRISPASYYSDPSLNYAIQDDELSFTISASAEGASIQKLDQATLKPIGEKIPAVGKLTLTHRVPTDYLVSCFSKKYTLRSFDDFEADCCLVIKDNKKFMQRLFNGVPANVSCSSIRIDSIKYLDPLNTNPFQVEPFFSKHFRYSYQNELRVVWLPSNPMQKMQPIYASIGSLEDIAELLTVSA